MGIRRVENMCGGKGHVIIKDILEGDELKGKCGLYAQVTIEKGCSLGYHEHHGETETYYILSGEGEYDDNGVKRPVKAGDITITPDGKGHGLTNTGDTDLVFMALIIFDPYRRKQKWDRRAAFLKRLLFLRLRRNLCRSINSGMKDSLSQIVIKRNVLIV